MADAGRNLCPFVQSWHQDWLQCNLLQELKSFSDRSIPVLAASRSGAHVDRLWSWREADGWQSLFGLFGVMSCFFGNALCWDHSHRSTKRLLIYSFELGVSRIKYYVRLRCFWSLLWGFSKQGFGPSLASVYGCALRVQHSLGFNPKLHSDTQTSLDLNASSKSKVTFF